LAYEAGAATRAQLERAEAAATRAAKVHAHMKEALDARSRSASFAAQSRRYAWAAAALKVSELERMPPSVDLRAPADACIRKIHVTSGSHVNGETALLSFADPSSTESTEAQLTLARGTAGPLAEVSRPGRKTCDTFGLRPAETASTRSLGSKR
jgi:hypothetical protein